MMLFTHLSQRATGTVCANSSLNLVELTQIIFGSVSKSDRYYLHVLRQREIRQFWGKVFTGHDEPAAMNVYWAMATFTSDRTSGPVGSSLPAK